MPLRLRPLICSAAVALVAAAPAPLLVAADAPAKDAPAKAEQPAAKADANAKPDAGAKSDDGFVSLFNGKDMTGWVVTACTAKAENGNLKLVEGNGLVRTEKMYGDFVLELEWKNLQAAKFDSGVYFRSPKPKIGKRFPDKYQINLLQGEEGSIVTNQQAKVVGDAKVRGMAKNGEWNSMKLTCVGGKAELEVNGKPAWKVEGVTPAVGFIGLQCEVTAGGQFEFKNIRVKALTPPVAVEEE